MACCLPLQFAALFLSLRLMFQVNAHCDLTRYNIFDTPEEQTKVFDALRKAQSDGDLCKISEDGLRIGPYQISEQFYDNTVEGTNLKDGG